MSLETTIETVTLQELLPRVWELRRQNFRLVQIGATRLPEQIELTYSFDQELRLVNLRLQLSAEAAGVPSISRIYWCAFLYENEIHDLFGVQVDGIAVDFKGHLYQTAVKFPFGATKPPPIPVPAAAPTPTPATAAAPTPNAPAPATTSRHPSLATPQST